MSELISGKEAKLAWGNGDDVLYRSREQTWRNLNDTDFYSSIFSRESYEFKLKPKTLMLNGVEIPEPFEPKDGEECCFISDESVDGYHTISYNSERYSGVVFGLYRPSDIEQVVSALRSIFSNK